MPIHDTRRFSLGNSHNLHLLSSEQRFCFQESFGTRRVLLGSSRPRLSVSVFPPYRAALRYDEGFRKQRRHSKLAGISRKELKTDGLVAEVTKTVDFVQTHRQNLIVGGIVAALVIVVVGGGYLFYTKRTDAANLALGNALRTFHAPVRAASLSDTPEDLIFATDKERQERAIKEFQG